MGRRKKRGGEIGADPPWWSDGHDEGRWERAWEAYHRGETPTQKQLPPPDPARVAAAVAAMSRVEIGIPADYTTLTTYVVAENGIFRVSKTALGQMVVKLEGLPTVVGKLEPGFHLTVPRIPFHILNTVVSFFRAVCAKAGQPVEAYCQVWYHTADNRWEIRVPEQDVSGGSVSHRGDFAPAEGSLHVMDIHSHGSMSAFFSGVDDADEKVRGTKIFGVVGKVNTEYPETEFRVGRGDGTFIPKVALSALFEAPTEGLLVRVDPLIAAAGGSVKVSPYLPVDVPTEWLAQVTTSRPATVIYHRQGHGQMSAATHFRDGWHRLPGSGAWVRDDPSTPKGPIYPVGTRVIQSLAGTFVVERDRLTYMPVGGSK